MLKFKKVLQTINNYNNKNFNKISICNLALLDNNYDEDNDDTNNLFIEKIIHNNSKKYFTITKKPYYLDEDYKEENYLFKKIDNICESSGSKCIKCNGIGFTLNSYLKYDICKLCNGSGII